MSLRHKHLADESLASIELFRNASRAELERASRLLTPVTIAAGDTLIQQGTVGREYIIVGDGTLGVSRYEDTSGTVIGLSSGTVVGEMALLNRQRRSATVVALTTATIYVGTRQEFFALLDGVPSAGEQIVRAAAARTRANAA